jgi:hypothetical protein
MNCAWCGANADGSDSHGICADCEALYFPAKVPATDETKQEDEGNGSNTLSTNLLS